MIKINKIIPTALLLTSISSAALADNWNVGASASYAKIDGTARDTQTTGAGAIVAQDRGATSGDANFPFASIFVEYAKTLDKNLDLIIGLDYVPFKAEIDSKSFADLNTTGSVASNTSGTRKATLELENYATLYLQPTYKISGGTAVFGKVGYIHGDVQISGSNTATGSTINAKDTLNGYVVGLGVQHNINKNVFVRLEGSFTAHDDVTATDSLGTKFTADSELIAGKLSIGYSF
ncbi:MAG: porin family protein [Alphaproteobacteria bacterium]|nr:porin family protein [Candidatus Fonsibacter sp. PEL55]